MSVNLFKARGTEDLDTTNQAIAKASKMMSGGKKIGDLTPVAPIAVEMLVTAQMNHYADNDQNVRSRTLFYATFIGIGWALTLIARIIRVAIRTLGMPLSVAIAAFQQSRYGEMKKNEQEEKILKHNLVSEDLKRIGQEWVDLGTTLLTPLIGSVNFFAPSAISTEFLYKYYTERTALNNDRNEQFDAAKKAYLDMRQAKHDSWQKAQNETKDL